MKELQFITHCNSRYGYVESARLALEGGCRWIQLRMKDAPAEEILANAEKIRRMCDSYKAVLILDDHVELVEQCGADGVHLGKNDMPVNEARKILGPGKIIGGTANTLDDIRMHYANGADYIGCGPYRFTSTKKNLSPLLGTEGYRSITAHMKEENIHIPVVAIGGILFEDIDGIMETGVSGIAISGSIMNAENPVLEMERTVAKINEYIKRKH